MRLCELGSWRSRLAPRDYIKSLLSRYFQKLSLFVFILTSTYQFEPKILTLRYTHGTMARYIPVGEWRRVFSLQTRLLCGGVSPLPVTGLRCVGLPSVLRIYAVRVTFRCRNPALIVFVVPRSICGRGNSGTLIGGNSMWWVKAVTLRTTSFLAGWTAAPLTNREVGRGL
ncbi:hypothetical protein BKA63DRAFT_503516 [Paraphoma chrysanthemicola]|nr:hypothetical protein BKA63DRAFT_503516 [Paraphoma chrysanthemicola]